jgi:hypothetical protein
VASTIIIGMSTFFLIGFPSFLVFYTDERGLTIHFLTPPEILIEKGRVNRPDNKAI